jgi:hypothetical protein
MTFSVHRLAEAEVLRAAKYYNRASGSLRDRFLVEVEATYGRIRANPLLGFAVPRLAPVGDDEDVSVRRLL